MLRGLLPKRQALYRYLLLKRNTPATSPPAENPKNKGKKVPPNPQAEKKKSESPRSQSDNDESDDEGLFTFKIVDLEQEAALALKNFPNRKGKPQGLGKERNDRSSIKLRKGPLKERRKKLKRELIC